MLLSMNQGPEKISKNSLEKPPQFPKVANEIQRMITVDQEMREKSLDADSDWDEEVDIKNTEVMKRIVREIGWPTISKVGKESSESAWLLVQHSDHDPDFQQQCLDLMKAEADGEVSQVDIAYLEDRVRVNTNRGQIYGTQFHETRDAEGNILKYEPQPIEEPEHLDERRANLGLEPHAEYTGQLTQKYFPHLLKRE